jgi:hypothetical protein
METRRFLDFVVISSADSLSIGESETSRPLWTIERRLFAGQPLLSITTRTTVRTTITTIVLSGARYPGTNLSADFSIEITAFPGDQNQSASQDITLGLAFGNASFEWEYAPIDTDPATQVDSFLEWLKRRAPVTTQISIGGNIATFANGESIDFGTPTSATLKLEPGTMTVEGNEVCTSNVAGITFTASSLSVPAPNPFGTDLVIQVTSPLSVPVPSPTPLGNLTPRPGFSVVTVHASETQQSATFSAANSANLYVLQLPVGVTDVEGNTVRADLNAGEVDFDLNTVPPQIRMNASGSLDCAYLLSAGVGLRVPFSPQAGFASINISMLHSGTDWQVVQASIPVAGVVPPLGDAMTEAIDSGVILALLPAGTAADPAANASWLVVGPAQAGDIRLRVTPFAFSVIRPTDLLVLQFRFSGVALRGIDGQSPELVAAEAGHAGTLSVVLPPQHTAEEAYYAEVKGFGQDNQTPPDPAPDSLAEPPIGISVAGETRLAFAIPGDLSAKPLTLDGLLDWSAYALVPSSPGARGNKLTTSIELPYRLMLSDPLPQPETIPSGQTGVSAEYLIFVPQAVKSSPPDTVKVSLLFCVASEMNRHGLRTFFKSSPDRVLITIPGREASWISPPAAWGIGITSKQISDLFTSAGLNGQSWQVDVMAGFSTGYRGLNGTINNGLIPLGKLQTIIFYDALYRGDDPPPGGNTAATLGKLAATVSVVTYQVTDGGTPQPRRVMVPASGLIDLRSRLTPLMALIMARVVQNGVRDNYVQASEVSLQLQTLISSLPVRGTLASSDLRAAQASSGTLRTWSASPSIRGAIASLNFNQTWALIRDKRLMGWAVSSPGDLAHDGFIPEFGWEFLAG